MRGFSRLDLAATRMFDFEEAFKLVSKQTILCVGDLMLDDFVYGEVTRISPEAPTPVLRVRHSEIGIGGAGNVARNIAALGARCIFVGLIGNDDAGLTLTNALAKINGNSIVPDLVIDEERRTDHAKGALRIRTPLGAPGASRLGDEQRRQAREPIRAHRLCGSGVAAGRCGGAVGLRQRCADGTRHSRCHRCERGSLR